MDKVKIALEMIKKHHFWILSAVIIVLGIAFWFSATGSLAKQYDEKKSAIESLFSSLSGVLGVGDHPNADVIAAMEMKRDKLKQDVFASWQKLYDEQKNKNELPPVLGVDFADHWEDKELPRDLRARYMNFITEHIPTLFDKDMADIVRPRNGDAMIAAEAIAGPGNPGAGFGVPREGQPEIETIGTVHWDAGDRNRLIANFTWDRVPSTPRVRLAQEDLWVYEALVRVIRNTNKFVGYSKDKECTGNHNANIKRIRALDIGKRAVDATADNRVVTLAAGADTGGAIVAGPNVDIAAGDAGTLDLLTGRYVDETGKPLAAGQVRHAEYKIMPIRMKLDMSQMMIPKLLVECANASMPIEVRRVRLQPDMGAGPLNLANAAASKAGEGVDLAAGGGMHGGGMRLGPLRDQGGAATTDGSDIAVEISGFIYIYKPPDKEALGTGDAAQEPEPGPEEPGPEEPGPEEPGPEEPGPEEPGPEEPGPEKPGTEKPKPAETSAPTVTPATRPGTRPGMRPGTRPGGMPGTRPGMAPATRPGAAPPISPTSPGATPSSTGVGPGRPGPTQPAAAGR